MLADARTALKVSQAQPERTRQAESIMAVLKALNRAGGFLEATSIAIPELGLELIDEFEAFAREIEAKTGRPARQWLSRALGDRRQAEDRRSLDRRLLGERRTQELTMVAERRAATERRSADRRTGPRRTLGDRRAGPNTGHWAPN